MAVIDRDLGMRAAIEAIARLAETEITVGIHGDQVYVDEEGAERFVAEYASYNEFGTSRIPERSFMRRAFREKSQGWGVLLGRGVAAVSKIQLTPEQVAQLVGLKAVADVQQTIVDVVSPPNAPRTVARKLRGKKGPLRLEGGVETGNPLIDTGRMRQSVRHKVTHTPGAGRALARLYR